MDQCILIIRLGTIIYQSKLGNKAFISIFQKTSLIDEIKTIKCYLN